MKIVFLKQAERELRDSPPEIVRRLFPLLDELSQGRALSMPVSRPLSSVAKGLHEIRLSSRASEYRVFYVIRVGAAIYIIHVAHKKSQKTGKNVISLLKSRIKELE